MIDLAVILAWMGVGFAAGDHWWRRDFDEPIDREPIAMFAAIATGPFIWLCGWLAHR